MMERYRFDVVGFTIDLKELAKYVPVSKPSPRAFAYVLLLHYIMIGIADGSLKNNRSAIISLIHDRSEYDSVLLDAFNILAKDQRLLRGCQAILLNSPDELGAVYTSPTSSSAGI